MSRESDATRLVVHIRESQREECERLIAEARGQAREILDGAWQTARKKLHATVVQERERLAREAALSAARIHTARREHAQQRHQALLGAAMQGLGEELAHRWQQERFAARWIEQLVNEAGERLPAEGWEVVHGDVWTPTHEGILTSAMAGIEDWSAVHESGMGPGLRIARAGVVLDASLATLLNDARLKTDMVATLVAHESDGGEINE